MDAEDFMFVPSKRSSSISGTMGVSSHNICILHGVEDGKPQGVISNFMTPKEAALVVPVLARGNTLEPGKRARLGSVR